MARDLQEQKLVALTRARDLVKEQRAESSNVAAQAEILREQRAKEARAIRNETQRNKKMISK